MAEDGIPEILAEQRLGRESLAIPVLSDASAASDSPSLPRSACTAAMDSPAWRIPRPRSRARLSTERASRPGASALTAAELRLLPLLATHMPVPEIASELFLSPYTIRSQLKSAYRKLDVSSRSQAVTRFRELGLLDG
jgi:DNA-binding CsgD family transcriptional regulator